MRPSRREILDENQLLPAPRACQQLFWLRYNKERRRQRPVHLSDALVGVVSDVAVYLARRLGGLAEAWEQVVPAEYASATQVESFSNGRLVVSVDSAATKYVLGRGPLLEVLNEQVLRNGGRRAKVVRQIEFRVGSPRKKGIGFGCEIRRGSGRKL